jgi:hypothetical protein
MQMVLPGQFGSVEGKILLLHDGLEVHDKSNRQSWRVDLHPQVGRRYSICLGKHHKADHQKSMDRLV